jgi:hypothetical protein
VKSPYQYSTGLTPLPNGRQYTLLSQLDPPYEYQPLSVILHQC